jgi:hypothetical protein
VGTLRFFPSLSILYWTFPVLNSGVTGVVVVSAPLVASDESFSGVSVLPEEVLNEGAVIGEGCKLSQADNSLKNGWMGFY